MDWHKNHDEYVNAKKNIVSHQTSSNFSVINSEYETTKSFASLTKGKVIYFSKDSLEDKYKEKLLLRGEHNLENIAAAVTVGKIIKIDEKTILETVRNFKGLEHRLELVAEIDGVKYYNDSFATGPQPTIAAINSFKEPETLILGGSDKGLNYEELGQTVSKKKNVDNIILIGDTRVKILEALKKFSFGGNIIDMEYSPMSEIVEKTSEISRPGNVVILSPASASFDMFKNYKDRGNQFKKAVLDLKD
jgi:UDP-N-acetylmuramoylalanine--D-glutamate ligase